MAFVHVQASDGESADDEEEHHSEEEPEEHEDPSLLSEPSVELSTPKETCAVLVKRFHQLLRAGRHSSGSRFQLAVHAGRMSDSALPSPLQRPALPPPSSSRPNPWACSHPGDWQQLQRIVGKEVGWSIERHRIASDQYDVKACYREQPLTLTLTLTVTVTVTLTLTLTLTLTRRATTASSQIWPYSRRAPPPPPPSGRWSISRRRSPSSPSMTITLSHNHTR